MKLFVTLESKSAGIIFYKISTPISVDIGKIYLSIYLVCSSVISKRAVTVGKIGVNCTGIPPYQISLGIAIEIGKKYVFKDAHFPIFHVYFLEITILQRCSRAIIDPFEIGGFPCITTDTFFKYSDDLDTSFFKVINTAFIA